MAQAASSVSVNVKFSGVDNVSKSAKSATSAVDQFGKNVKSASDRVASLRGSLSTFASGDIVGGFGALKSSLSGAGGIVGTAGLAAAGLVGVGVAAAAAAVKITQLTYETNRLNAQANLAFSSDQGLAAALQIARDIGGVGAENIVKLQSVLQASGISAKLTTEQLQELAGRATQAGKSGDDALQAFAQAIETGNARALRSVGVFVNSAGAISEYARAHGIAADQIDESTRRQIEFDLILEELDKKVQRSTTTYDLQDQALADLSNAFLELKVAISDAIGGDMADAVKTVASFTSGLARSLDTVGSLLDLLVAGPLQAAFVAVKSVVNGAAAALAAAELQFGVARELLEEVGEDALAVGERFGGAWDRLTSENEKGAQKLVQTSVETTNAFGAIFSQAREVQTAFTATVSAIGEAEKREESAKRAREAAAAKRHQAALARSRERATAERAAAQEVARIEQELAATIQARNIADQETRVLQAEARVATAKTEQEQIAAATLLAQEQLNTQLQALERERDSISGEAAQRRIDALKALNAAALAETIRGIEERAAAERKQAAEAPAKQFQDALTAIQTLQTQLGSLDSTIANTVAALPQIGFAIAQGIEGGKDNLEAFTAATNVAGGAILGLSDAETQRAVNTAKTEEEKAKAVEDGERRKAAILAVMAAAQAALEVASGNIPGAIAAGAAAALYGSIAGGIVSTSRSGAGVASAGSTTGGGAGLGTTMADQATATAGNVNINFGAGFVIGTTQQVGKAVAGSLKSLQTTGLAMAGGV
jgi:hypothetical protein